MLIKRKISVEDSIGGCGGCNNGINKTLTVKKLVPIRRVISSTNSLKDAASSQRHESSVNSNPKIIVQRVPFFTGGISPALLDKKFQRPCIKRRSYSKQADVALQQCSLGQKRRVDGMARILARAGRPLSFKLHQDNTKKDDNSDGSDDENDENSNKESDKPFEPLEVWKSPHLGGRLIGLPSQM